MLRGVRETEAFVINNHDILIPANCARFLCNGNNKERLFEVREEVRVAEKAALGNRTIHFSRQNGCTRIRRGGATPFENLQTNQEEADTRVCILLYHAFRSNNGGIIKSVLRSSSGNIDIPSILLTNEAPNLIVYIDSGTGNRVGFV